MRAAIISGVAIVIVLVLALLLWSRQTQPRGGIDREPVYPATGQVFLNGEPAEGVRLTLYRKADVEAGKDPEGVQTHSGIVQADGSLAFTTYELGDGLPAGEYVVTFVWKETRDAKVSIRAQSIYKSQDKLGGQYSDPHESPYRLTVTEGGVNDLGRIDLEVDLDAVARDAANEPRNIDLSRDEDE